MKMTSSRSGIGPASSRLSSSKTTMLWLPLQLEWCVPGLPWHVVGDLAHSSCEMHAVPFNRLLCGIWRTQGPSVATTPSGRPPTVKTASAVSRCVQTLPCCCLLHSSLHDHSNTTAIAAWRRCRIHARDSDVTSGSYGNTLICSAVLLLRV